MLLHKHNRCTYYTDKPVRAETPVPLYFLEYESLFLSGLWKAVHQRQPDSVLLKATKVRKTRNCQSYE